MELQWYIPITILPGIAILILSTSNLLISVNSEIKSMKHEGEACLPIIALKLGQLKRLSWSLAALYTTVFLLTLSGIVAGILDVSMVSSQVAFFLMITAIVILSVALVLLIIYAFRGVYIRQEHLKI
jgi:hypothetical protein